MIGLDKTMHKLRRQLGNIEGATRNGLLAAGHYVKAKSMAQTPVEFGNLRASHYVSEGRLGDPTIEIGTTASYSMPVHERLDAYHPVGNAKFLERAIMENQKEILRIVQRFVKL